MVMSLCIDFDGVIHSYESGWRGIDVVTDPPVEGALEFLELCVEDPDFEVNIYSSRSKDPLGVAAMKEWFKFNNFKYIDKLLFPTQKPAAYLTIDDRCFHFQGTFPSIEFIKKFKPWNK